MDKKILLLCPLIFLPIVTSQTAEEVLKSIEELMQENENFQYPENYSEFKRNPMYYGGKFGRCNYDIIIIGGGSAGTVLANRLSEVSYWNILLLEAGGNDTVASDVPASAGLLQFSRMNWAYRSIPQKTCCLGMENNQCNIPRGKVLGGSSTINFMVYTRGNRLDYDKWSKDGNPGWSYDEVLPYFLKSENSSLTSNFDEVYHSKNGSLHVEHVRHFGPIGQAFLDGNVELGRNILDYNGKDEMGVSRLQSNTINGRRCSGNKAFLQAASKRKNLTILKGAFVTKLRVNTAHGNQVWGVDFQVGNVKYYARAKLEVILAAGAISSPQILMHSGIGPKDHLSSLGINVVSDVPVGHNLHDHLVLLYPFTTNFTDPGYNTLDKMVGDYLGGFGFLTSVGNIQSLGFINTEDKSSLNPDIEQMIIPYFDLTDGILQKTYNYKKETYDAFLKPFSASAMISVLILLHPKSRGSIILKSNNPFDHPLIDLNYFSDQDDMERMVRGVKDFFALVTTDAMKKFNVTIGYNPIPQCPQNFLSDNYLTCMTRHMSTSAYHQAGTCKMGPDSDPQAVVDARLRVRGVRGLRVVDASIIPSPLAAHTNAPVYMIAEKASDMIKEDHIRARQQKIIV